jgi:hypothetical protein
MIKRRVCEYKNSREDILRRHEEPHERAVQENLESHTLPPPLPTTYSG